MSAVDIRRAAVLAVGVAALAAAAVVPGHIGRRELEPATWPDRAPLLERPASHGPDQQTTRPAHPGRTGALSERATDADWADSDAAHGPGGDPDQRLTQTTAPRRAHEPAAGDPATPAVLPGTVRADHPPDAETLAAAREVAAAWVLAFTTRDSAQRHDAWLERLRPHSTARLLHALAHPATAEVAGQRPGSLHLLAVESGPATADRIGVRVRFRIDPDPAEHALEVVVVPSADGPRVDELRL